MFTHRDILDEMGLVIHSISGNCRYCFLISY